MPILSKNHYTDGGVKQTGTAPVDTVNETMLSGFRQPPGSERKSSEQTTKTIRKTALFRSCFYLKSGMTTSVFHHIMTDVDSIKFFFIFFVLTSPVLFAGTAVRTPQTSGEPHINDPSVIGVTPGNPFLYKIPVSGDSPIKITVTNLTDGFTVEIAGHGGELFLIR